MASDRWPVSISIEPPAAEEARPHAPAPRGPGAVPTARAWLRALRTPCRLPAEQRTAAAARHLAAPPVFSGRHPPRQEMPGNAVTGRDATSPAPVAVHADLDGGPLLAHAWEPLPSARAASEAADRILRTSPRKDGCSVDTPRTPTPQGPRTPGAPGVWGAWGEAAIRHPWLTASEGRCAAGDALTCGPGVTPPQQKERILTSGPEAAFRSAAMYLPCQALAQALAFRVWARTTATARPDAIISRLRHVKSRSAALARCTAHANVRLALVVWRSAAHLQKRTRSKVRIVAYRTRVWSLRRALRKMYENVAGAHAAKADSELVSVRSKNKELKALVERHITLANSQEGLISRLEQRLAAADSRNATLSLRAEQLCGQVQQLKAERSKLYASLLASAPTAPVSPHCQASALPSTASPRAALIAQEQQMRTQSRASDSRRCAVRAEMAQHIAKALARQPHPPDHLTYPRKTPPAPAPIGGAPGNRGQRGDVCVGGRGLGRRGEAGDGASSVW